MYPSDPDELGAAIDAYGAGVETPIDAAAPPGRLVGVVSPHIDYERGGTTYAELWQRSAANLEDVELAIILGTDHHGGPGTLTPTRQSYTTPLGVLPTAVDVVDTLAGALGPDRAFAEELHHVTEHSIELAAVWFHHAIGGRPCPVVPVLCGSFGDFVAGEHDPEESEPIESAVACLREAAAGRRTLVIAAADLAHVGPAFGDGAPVDAVGRTALAGQDAASIAAICDGDADAFFSLSRQERDARKICGLSPIYVALRLLGTVRGESLGYVQCPADVSGSSVVSIVGALLYAA